MNEVWIDGVKYVPELKIKPIESEGWIPHTGDECPVHPETEGIVRFRTGNETESGQFGTLCWKPRMEFCDIVGYKITKPYVKPKPTLMLIDWSLQGMEGCMTNEGKLFQSETSDRYAVVSSNRVVIQNSDLRLVTPKDREGWQSALNFEDIDAVIKKLQTQCVLQTKSSFLDGIVSVFRVTGLAEGYTDDPAKAGV